MPNPFTAKIWSAHAGYWVPDSRGGTDLVEWDDAAPFLDATLIRTLVWVHVAGYADYGTGAAAIPAKFVSFGLGETTSSNFNGNFPSDDPAADFIDYLATGSSTLDFTNVSFPPTSTSNLSGSVNSIDSTATIDTVYNTNEFLYGSTTMFADVKSQRRFGTTPHFQIMLQDLAGPFLQDYDRWGAFLCRFLWEQNV